MVAKSHTTPVITATATVAARAYRSTTVYRVDLADSPAIDLGAGRMTPTRAQVVHQIIDDGELVTVQLVSEAGDTLHHAPLAWAAEPDDLGYAGHLHVRDLPWPLQAALHDATGIALLDPAATQD